MPDSYVIPAGLYDTDNGYYVQVTGEAFPRVKVTLEGVFVGDGTEEPTVVTAGVTTGLPSVADLADDTYALQVTVADGAGDAEWVSTS